MTQIETESLAGLGRTQTALLRLLLRNKKGLTVDRIAADLGVTRTAVNQHLSALERGGYVARRDAVATGGRPGRLFALTESGIHLFPKNYGLLSLKAFEALIDALGAGKAQDVLERLGREMGAGTGAKLGGKKLEEKLPEIASVMRDLGFDAHIDAGGAASIKAYNCVYHSLARARPEICALDLALLREASGADVEHVCCMAKGDNECRFRFRNKEEA